MRVMKEITFDAAHNLRNYKGECKNLHGHQWKVQVIAEGKVGSNDMIIDFKELRRLMERVIVEKYDHKYLNEVPPFDVMNPTAENIAQVILTDLKKRNSKIVGVRIWETPTSCVELIV